MDGREWRGGIRDILEACTARDAGKKRNVVAGAEAEHNRENYVSAATVVNLCYSMSRLDSRSIQAGSSS